MVPTSRNRAPLCSIRSGSRNEPPISISSPRETTTSRPSASELSASSTAAALLLTTVAASAPVSAHNASSTSASRSPRPPPSRSYSRLTADRPAAAIASIAGSASSARPRLVWSTTPVALTTVRKAGSSASIAACVRRTISSTIDWRVGAEGASASPGNRTACRSSAWARRTISLRYSRPRPSIPATPSQARRHSSTGGIARNNSARASRPACALAASAFFAFFTRSPQAARSRAACASAITESLASRITPQTSAATADAATAIWGLRRSPI